MNAQSEILKLPIAQELRIKGYRIPIRGLAKMKPDLLRILMSGSLEMHLELVEKIVKEFYELPEDAWASFWYYDYECLCIVAGIFSSAFAVPPIGAPIQMEPFSRKFFQEFKEVEYEKVQKHCKSSDEE